MVFFLKILKKKIDLNGSQNWQKLDSHCEVRKEAAKGNGKKVDMLIARLVLFQVSLPALTPSGPPGLGWFCRLPGFRRTNEQPGTPNIWADHIFCPESVNTVDRAGL